MNDTATPDTALPQGMRDALDRMNISLQQLDDLTELVNVLPAAGHGDIAPRALAPVADTLGEIHSDLLGHVADMKRLLSSREGRATVQGSEFAETIDKVAAQWTSAPNANPDATLLQICAAEKAVSDAQLIGWCAALVAMEAAWKEALNEGKEAVRPPAYYETLHAVESTPARTDAGNRAKLAAAVAFFDPAPPETGSLFSAILWDAATGLAALPNAALDASLIHLCDAEHAAAQAVNSYELDIESDDDPVYNAWQAAAVALDQTAPKTLEGLAAKARAALRRGTSPTGKRNTDEGAGFAWAIVEDVIRLQGGEA